MKEYLSIEHVEKSFTGDEGRHIQVLRDVTFSAEKGERIALLGKSGCGKTTLLNLIAGFDTADGGTVSVNGKTVTGPSAEKAVVFQSPALFSWSNAMQNVTFPLKRRGMRKGERIQEAKKMLERVGLKDFERYYPHELSGGMQQRVALARVFVMRPPLLLMDEPFAALDPHLREQMQDLLLSLWEEYRPAVVFVTHDVEEAVRLADKVIVLGDKPSTVKFVCPVCLSLRERTDRNPSETVVELKKTLRQQLFPEED